MAGNKNIKEKFKSGQIINCMLSGFFENFILDEYNVYFKKTEEDKWVVYGVCYIAFPSSEGWEYEEYTFCLKLIPEIENVNFYRISTQTRTHLNPSDFNDYFEVNKNGFYFFPLDSYEITPADKVLKCGFYSYVEINFDIKDCEIELKRIPTAVYNEIDPENPLGENITIDDNDF